MSEDSKSTRPPDPTERTVMGTRGFVGFVIDGTEKIAYNHFDSYPEGLGMDVLGWLWGIDRDVAEGQVRELRVVDPKSMPTEADIVRLGKWRDLRVSERSIDDWYCLLRKTQGDPAAMLEAGVIEDGSAFPADSLFAEWGYVVDFDQGLFEVYQGFQKAAHNLGRFARQAGQNGYAPVKLVATWSLGDLPDKERFHAALREPDDE